MDENPSPFHHLTWLDVEEGAREHAKPVTNAVPTCLPKWTRACRDEGGGKGLAPGWYITVSGQTGQGKSLFAVNLAAEAMRHGKHVAYLSYEMSRKQTFTRFLAIASGANVRRLEPGEDFDPKTWTEAGQVFRDQLVGPLYIADEPGETVSELHDTLEHAYDEGADLVIVDYIQIACEGENGGLYDQMRAVTHLLRRYARTKKVVVVGISQPNRAQSFGNRKESPVAEGLAGGSSIENNSNQVLLLDGSTYQRATDGVTATTHVLLKKNRHGPQLTIPVKWDYRTLRIHESNSADEAQQRIRQREGL